MSYCFMFIISCSLHLFFTLVLYACSSHLFFPLVFHTCSSHLFFTLVLPACSLHLFFTLVFQTRSPHTFTTPVHHTRSPHTRNSLQILCKDSKVQIHNGKFTRQKFHTAFFQGKIPKAKFCSGKLIHGKHPRQNSALQIFASAERVSPRGGSLVNH